MTTPVVVTAIFTPAEGQHDAVVAALQPVIAAVHEEDGCLLYAIHDAPDGSIVMIEKWQSAELLDAHGDAPAVTGLRESLEGKLAKPIDVTRLTPIPAGTKQMGEL